jgi:hypothetical protein
MAVLNDAMVPGKSSHKILDILLGNDVLSNENSSENMRESQ